MSNGRSVIHDGQGDAMPCECAACRSLFTRERPFKRRPYLVLVSSPAAAEVSRDFIQEARAC